MPVISYQILKFVGVQIMYVKLVKDHFLRKTQVNNFQNVLKLIHVHLLL